MPRPSHYIGSADHLNLKFFPKTERSKSNRVRGVGILYLLNFIFVFENEF
jgi:hypothetical protein